MDSALFFIMTELGAIQQAPNTKLTNHFMTIVLALSAISIHYRHQGGCVLFVFVSLFVCPSVRLLATLQKKNTTEQFRFFGER